MNIGRKCRTRTTKTARGSATGATMTEVCATGSLSWTKIGASALRLRRPSMFIRYATTTIIFFVIKHDFNYFNVYFSSFPIRLAYPMLCKTLCLGDDEFWRPWKYGNKENSPKDPSWYKFWSKSVKFWECNPFVAKIGKHFARCMVLMRVYACHHGSWWSYNRARETFDLRSCGYTTNSSPMWVSQT